ncbi:hypothetical protein [Ruegeria sp. EL01]|jgi:hypothetical protein|uniref:hypothetical protein n=1 Tax=Ruegeria sp. EL01 TaxID=2107578 RepID=UPI0020B116EB|nr:hypothetical protein [Ruegeria sp. EL01]
MFRKFSVASVASTPFSTSAIADGHGRDIVDTAVATGGFETLVVAVQAAKPVDTLDGDPAREHPNTARSSQTVFTLSAQHRDS